MNSSSTPTRWILVLECSDCGSHARTIEEAAEHELANSTPDEPHGGWDTLSVPVAPQALARHGAMECLPHIPCACHAV